MTTATKERGIMFSGPMVRGILDDRKTQTRRVLRPQPPSDARKIKHLAFNVWGYAEMVGYPSQEIHQEIKCPYGVVGDRLWVRETWQVYHKASENEWSVLTPTGKTDRDGKVFYRATMKEPDPDKHGRLVWRSAMLMPRWAARIVLEITEIRVQRLKKIDGFDARDEGFPEETPDYLVQHYGYGRRTRKWFRELWDSINADRGFGWKTNPWVWAITFKKITK